MLKSCSNFLQRTISTLIFIPSIVFAIYWSEWSYFSLFFYILLLAMLEFYKLIKISGALPLRIWGTLVSLSIYTITFIHLKKAISTCWFYLLIPLFVTTYFIKLYDRKSTSPFMDIAYTFLGIFYIGVPITMLHLIVFSKGHYNYEIVLGIMCIVWANDTGSYFLGSMIGKHKLFQQISPKKTWEGVLGGVIASLVISYIISQYFTILVGWQWFTIAGIIMFAGTYGDLLASLFKRSINIKDAGNTIPGHGGLLDRIDSLLITIPLILAFIKVFA